MSEKKKFLSGYFDTVNNFFSDNFLGSSLGLKYAEQTTVVPGCIAGFQPSIELDLPSSNSSTFDDAATSKKSGLLHFICLGSIKGGCNFTQQLKVNTVGEVDAALELSEIGDRMNNLTISGGVVANMQGISAPAAIELEEARANNKATLELEYGREGIWLKAETEGSLATREFNSNFHFSAQRSNVLIGLQVSNNTADQSENELTVGFGCTGNGWKICSQAVSDVDQWRRVAIGVEHTANKSETTAIAQFKLDLTAATEPVFNLGAVMPLRVPEAATRSVGWMNLLPAIPQKWALMGGNDGSLASSLFFENLQPGLNAQCTTRWHSNQFYSGNYRPSLGVSIEIGEAAAFLNE